MMISDTNRFRLSLLLLLLVLIATGYGGLCTKHKSGSSGTDTTSGSSALVTTVSAVGVTDVSAVLNGTVNPNGIATEAYFEWGLSDSLGNRTANIQLGSAAVELPVSDTLTALTPNTTYYYRMTAAYNTFAGAAGSAYGETKSFSTAGAPIIKITGVDAANDSAVLSGMVNPNGLATTAYFEYGLTTAYGSKTLDINVGSGSVDSPISATLTSLLSNTTYYYKLVAVNSGGVSEIASSFTTASLLPGQVVAPAPANNATGVSVNQQLSWAPAANAASYQVCFGTGNPPPVLTVVTGASYNPGALSYSYNYYWRINSKNTNGATTGLVWKFTTSGGGAPALNAIGNKTAGEGVLLSFTISATDPNSDTITYSSPSSPTGASLNSSTGLFQWTPSYAQSGYYTVAFRAADSGGLYSEETIIITVNNNDQPPELTLLTDKLVSEGQAISFTLTATDADLDVITYVMTPTPTGATLNYATGLFSWTPSYTQAGAYPITFTARAKNLSDSQTITITITNVDRPPVLTSPGNKSVNENANLSFTLAATDPDGDTVTYSGAGLPGGSTLTSTNGAFSWTPSYTQAGAYVVTFTATAGGLTDSKAITITVTNVDRPPVLTSPGPQTVNENQLLTINLSATDADGDLITYSKAFTPGGSSLVSNVFSWTPTYTQSGVYPITFTATANGQTDSKSITITVNDVLSPSVVTIAATTVMTTSAVLNGTVNPNGWTTNAYFEWGLTTSYGNTTSTQDLGNGTGDVAVNASIGGLSPSTLYNFRAVAANIAGTTYGTNLTFTTPSVNSDLSRLVISEGTLNPAFASNTTNYNVIFITQSSIIITPTAQVPASTITVNGASVVSGQSSNPIALADGPNLISIVVTATDQATAKTYKITVNKLYQQAYVKASNTGTGDLFGASIAISGDTMVVGTTNEDSSTTGINSTPDELAADSGAAYVFVRSGATWSQQAYIKPSNTDASDGFGVSVGISGDTIVVCATGEDSSTVGIDSTPNELSADSGAAYVFVRSGTTWSQQAYIKPSNTGASDNFGYSVAISGDTIVVGTRYEDSSSTGINSTPNELAADSGAAYIFIRSGTTWSQQTYIKPSNTGLNDGFGTSVAISGDTMVVGSLYEDSGTTGINSTPDETITDSGAAYVFVRSGVTWYQQAYVKPSNTGLSDAFGRSVSISGDTLAVGAVFEDSSTTGVNSTPDELATDSGAVYVFVRSGTTWSQQAYVKPAVVGTTQAGDRIGGGWSVSVSGDTLAVGAFYEDSSTTGINSTPNELSADSGAIYIFKRTGTAWAQQSYIKPFAVGTTQANDQFGWNVALSGDTVAVGARYEDSSTIGINSTPDEAAADSGAAYIFNIKTASANLSSLVISTGIMKPSAVIVPDLTGYNINTGIQNSITLTPTVAQAGATISIQGVPVTSGQPSSPIALADGPNSISIVVTATDLVTVKTYTVTVERLFQQAYAKASNTGAGDWFGYSVAVSGDTMVVGAPLENSDWTGCYSSPPVDNNSAISSGAVYVYVRSGATWSQQAYIKPANTGTGDNFGWNVAISGDTLVVGAYLENSSTTGINSTSDELSGDSGAAYVFVRSGTTWAQQAYIKPSNTGAGDQFGYSVAVYGDTMVVGSVFEDSSTTGINSTPNESAADSGAVYVFVRSGATWSQQAYIKPASVGATQAGDRFGYSVDIFTDTIVVGARYEDSGTTGINSTPNEAAADSGAGYVFTRSGSTWSQQAYIKPAAIGTTQVNDSFGAKVAISDDTVAIGSAYEDSGTTGINSTPDETITNSGAAFIFVRSGTTWTQQAYIKPTNTGAEDRFSGVSLSGNTLLVGSPLEASSTTGINSTPNESAANSGAAYIFVRSGTTWSQQAYIKPSNTEASDFFFVAAISGDTIVVGAREEDSNATGVNGNQTDNSAVNSGAVYIFRLFR